MTPVISIIGKSKSGKTTLIEKLIPELKSRGYRVATIKHTPDDVTLDEPGKDSWRHIQSGSEATIIRTSAQVTMIKPMAEASIENVVPLFAEDYDIILAEGFKHDSAPKIEVHRKEAGSPLKGVKKLAAIVSDEPLDTKTRQFALDDIASLVDLLETGFIRPEENRVTLLVNGSDVPLSGFPKDYIAGILTAMATGLRGVGEVQTLKFFLKKGKPGQD
ncbi:MAG: molybdopterin-guanine dinucleotide biosynthesis protein B [Dehalococcoidales bacterium]|nr:MAG: molybdopterin-guanine dinucleotide biosynthesis protein B [Dehalococcoidales bacterium]